MLHNDNVSSHKAVITLNFLREHYSCLYGRRFTAEEDTDIAVRQFFDSITQNKWRNVFNISP